MKYIIRLMAAIPMLGSAIATLFLFILSFDYSILVIPTMLSLFGFPVCAKYYEETVKDVAVFMEKMAKDALMVVLLLLLPCGAVNAQEVIHKGNTFTQVSKKKEKKQNQNQKGTPTAATFIDSKGVSHIVYLSPTGKAYIERPEWKSKRQYVPKIGKIINPSAYKDEKD